MIIVSLLVSEINDINGSRSNVVSNRIMSGDSFEVSGTSVRNQKMLPESVVNISDIVDLESVTSVTIVSKCLDESISPLFDVSIMDSTGSEPLYVQRCSMYSIVGMQSGSSNSIRIDNMESVEGSEISVLITLKK